MVRCLYFVGIGCLAFASGITMFVPWATIIYDWPAEELWAAGATSVLGAIVAGVVCLFTAAEVGK